MDKNVNGINKIIATLSKRDYKTQWNRLTKRQKDKYKFNGGFSYVLSAETLECVEIKHDYLNGKISEAEYKSFLLRKVLSV